jgi:hypothetical protein
METKLELANRYRTTWEEFVRATNALQESLAASAPDPARTQLALFEAEKARFRYNAARDLLAAQMAGSRAVADPPSQTLAQEGQIRSMALLLWELSGRPEGTAMADWLHAERLVQSASAAVAR